LFPWRRRPGQSDAEHKLKELDDPFGIAMQQGKVSDPSESFRQDMEHQAPEEFCTRVTLDHLLPLVIFDAKDDDPIAIAKDILFRDHTTIKVATEVDQGLLTPPSCLQCTTKSSGRVSLTF
jgi:hypothetical protein